MYVLAEARKYMPVAVGAILSMHTNRAWEAKYPVKVAPFSHSRKFTPADAESSFAALKEVLRWAWKHHHTATGEKPPFDLGLELT